MYAKSSSSLLRICVYAQKNPMNDYCKKLKSHVTSKAHVSIKDLRICANNPALEGFVIRNHY